MADAEMSKAQFTIAYDGEALRDGTMDVRALAPALLAVGQLIDAANSALNGKDTNIAVKVRATHPGCFNIDLDIIQTVARQIVGFLKGDEATAASNLLALLGGASGGATGLFLLIKKLRGQKPEKVERLDADTVRITHGSTTLIVPLKVMQLYQDLAVRDAAEKVVYEPLLSEGIDTFIAFKGHADPFIINDEEAFVFKKPEDEEHVLLDDVRRSAFSIVALAFKHDNKWRLYDGNSQISATINDLEFLSKVNNNEVSFSKGDVLICDVRVRQMQSADTLRTEYTVEKVVDHKPAARQLRLNIEEPTPPVGPQTGRYENWE
ncbi:hypothetical protein [Methylobacterium sp. Leaf85]|uniref:hypothetical protein n=1 Tax=Methylobacterium sp. Leaf85 TaxID=1736241 RepID=UPI000AF8893E|nr:hypothetical protein [Methylobacterium sp. Leaf85]